MNFSRILGALKMFALGFAAAEVAVAAPHVNKAVNELSADLKSSDPIGAFVKTAHDAYVSMRDDPAITPSLTGILGAVASAALAGFAGSQSQPEGQKQHE